VYIEVSTRHDREDTGSGVTTAPTSFLDVPHVL
jgi:hypothetical protein